MLINFSRDAEGRTSRGCTVSAPWVHVSAVLRAGCTTRGAVLGFVFLMQNEKQVRWGVCWLQQCSTGCYGRLVSFLEGAKLHLLGELSFYQQERKITLLARHLTFSQRGEQQEVDECRGKTCPHCYARRLNYSCYRYCIWLIQAVNLNIHIICNDLVLTWSTIQFQDSASVSVLRYNKLWE